MASKCKYRDAEISPMIFQARIRANNINEAVEQIYRNYENITELRIWLSPTQPYIEPWYEYCVICDGKKEA